MRVLDAPSGQSAEFRAGPDVPLLDQIEEACCFDIPYACCAGVCGTCVLDVLVGGELLEREAFALALPLDPGPGRILACVTGIHPWAIQDDTDRLIVVTTGR
ncbi:MAG: 2Fe-2S iron-sulfur cluster binding domain-containing protein [Actinomycetota bacterium]